MASKGESHDDDKQCDGESKVAFKLKQCDTISGASLKRKGLLHHEVDQHETKRVCIEDSTDDDVCKLEAKRAYNRANAARARKRTKDHITELCRKVESLSDRNDSLEEKNVELTSRLTTLAEENKLLRSVILDLERGSRQMVAPSAGMVLPLLKQGMGQGLSFSPAVVQTQLPFFKHPATGRI